MAQIDVQFLIFTRFNLPLSFSKSAGSEAKNLDPNWLNKRHDLFFKYCKPSVMNQDDKEFKWFILFDEDTPSEFISAICDDSPAHPILAKGQGQAIRRSVEHIDMGRRTLSLRLDSDDAIAFDFVKTARHKSTMIGASLFIEKFAISFLKGCEYSAQQDIYFERRYFGSPFVVICEMPRAPGRYIGPFPTSHIQVPNMYPYLSMPSEHPMWQITIHGDNVANTVKGKTKINDVKHLFGF